MNLFGRAIPEQPPANTRRVFWAFMALLLIGAVLRAIACAYTAGIIHPDEHQQFLEQAYRLIHGYGKKFWEQDWGMRHPLYQMFLAIPLVVLEKIGITHPLVQAGIIRFIVALLALLSWALFAWQFQRRGDTTTALGLMVVFALSADLVYVQSHVLSEIAATIPFMLAVCWLDRRPIAAGIMLGVCFAIRFQMGFLIGGVVLLAWAGNQFRIRGPFLRFALASLGCLIVMGLIDWKMLGWPFKSPVQYFYANIWKGYSKQWGEYPWYEYFRYIWLEGGLLVIVPAMLLVIGAVREWRLALLLALFTLGHMAVAHKEWRFMLPVVPLALALIMSGLSRCLAALRPPQSVVEAEAQRGHASQTPQSVVEAEAQRGQASRTRRLEPIIFTIVLTIIAATSAWRVFNIEWERKGYREASLLLHEAGTRPDLNGVGVLGIHLSEYGNFFFLQRDVPLLGVVISEYPYFPDDPHLSDPQIPYLSDCRINYLIAPRDQLDPYAKWRPEVIASNGRFTLYRLDRSKH